MSNIALNVFIFKLSISHSGSIYHSKIKSNINLQNWRYNVGGWIFIYLIFQTQKEFLFPNLKQKLLIYFHLSNI